jgi:hypothetical protein
MLQYESSAIRQTGICRQRWAQFASFGKHRLVHAQDTSGQVAPVVLGGLARCRVAEAHSESSIVKDPHERFGKCLGSAGRYHPAYVKVGTGSRAQQDPYANADPMMRDAKRDRSTERTAA